MKDFRELKVWQKAHQLALEVYRQSAQLPTEERFGLTAHLPLLREVGAQEGRGQPPRRQERQDLGFCCRYAADCGSSRLDGRVTTGSSSPPIPLAFLASWRFVLPSSPCPLDLSQ